jgi:hypothetical protein
MKDSLDTIVEVHRLVNSNEMDILTGVDSFYNSAWNKLVLFGTIVIGVVGVIIPFWFQRLQNKTLKLNEQELKNAFDQKLNEVKESLEKMMAEKFEVLTDDLNLRIEELAEYTRAQIFHLQAIDLFQDGDYKSAFGDFLIASDGYLNANVHNNLLDILGVIYNDCLEKISSDDINEVRITHKIDINDLIEKIERQDKHGSYTTMVRNIRLKLIKLK